jgi:hypothetical protein
VIATEDFAAARSQAAQLLRSLIKQDVGVIVHGVPLGHHID